MVSQQRQTPLLAKDHDLTSLTRLSGDRRRRKRLVIAGVAAAVVGGGSLVWMLTSIWGCVIELPTSVAIVPLQMRSCSLV